jgi:hypothetical protein
MFNEFRGDSLYLANVLHPKGIGVELGVHKGEFSEYALSVWKQVSEYWLVDTWNDNFDKIQNPDTYFDKHNNSILNDVKQKFSREPYKILVEDSIEASNNFKEVSWVYLDNNHTFEHVYNELLAWWSKLSVNGIFSGHDYDVTGYRSGIPVWVSVVDAVNLFAKTMQVPIYYSCDRQDWWTIKSSKVEPSDVLVISDSNLNWQSRDIILENHRNYCEAWGYEYRHHSQVMPGYHGPWAKVQGLINAMLSTDKQWICWFDADLVITDYSENQHKHCHDVFEQVLGAFRNHWHPNGGPNTSHWILKNSEYNLNVLKKLLTMRHWAERFCHEENALDELEHCRSNPKYLLIPSVQWSLDPQWMHLNTLTNPSAYIHVPNGNGPLRHGIISDLCSFAKRYN